MNQHISENVLYIESVLEKALPKKEGYQKTIFEAMEYALMAGGKRIRPLFMLEVYRMFGGDKKQVIEPFMAALEMIHTYSLVHDDLPAMDDDEMRRGRKTTHIVYGEDMGILAGDALLNYAYETASQAFIFEDSLGQTSKAFRVLAQKAGVFGMVGGQVVDVEMNGQIPGMDMLQFIYQCKTSALLEISFMVGGILAGAEEEAIGQLEQIARNVGIAFQIQDDILDVTSTEDVLGKPIHSDEKNEKSTYVSFCGMEKAKEAVKEIGRASCRERVSSPV